MPHEMRGATHKEHPMKNIVERARSYLAKMPGAVSGQGGHNATFAAAVTLVRGFALSETDALPLLLEWNAKCIPPWTEAELRHKLCSAANSSSKPNGYLLGEGVGPHPPPRTAKGRPRQRLTRPRISDIQFDAEKLARIAANLPEANAEWFKQRSPRALDGMCVESFLHAITNPGDRLVCFTRMESRGQFVWHNLGGLCVTNSVLSRWRHGLEKGAWFLPQPVTGEWLWVERLKSKTNPSGQTRRAEENVTAFRYAIIESDKADSTLWLAALAQLPLPIVSVVTSGGDSIHALLLVNARSKEEWDKIVRDCLLPPLKTMGADHKTLTAVHLTRLPFVERGPRGEEKLQELLYLNTEPTAQPIANLQPRQCYANIV